MSADTTSGSIQSRKDYKDTPEGQAEYWEAELKGSEKNLRNFHIEGSKIDTRFKGGKRKEAAEGSTKKRENFRLNLFHSKTG